MEARRAIAPTLALTVAQGLALTMALRSCPECGRSDASGHHRVKAQGWPNPWCQREIEPVKEDLSSGGTDTVERQGMQAAFEAERDRLLGCGVHPDLVTEMVRSKIEARPFA